MLFETLEEVPTSLLVEPEVRPLSGGSTLSLNRWESQWLFPNLSSILCQERRFFSRFQISLLQPHFPDKCNQETLIFPRFTTTKTSPELVTHWSRWCFGLYCGGAWIPRSTFRWPSWQDLTSWSRFPNGFKHELGLGAVTPGKVDWKGGLLQIEKSFRPYETRDRAYLIAQVHSLFESSYFLLL